MSHPPAFGSLYETWQTHALDLFWCHNFSGRLFFQTRRLVCICPNSLSRWGYGIEGNQQVQVKMNLSGAGSKQRLIILDAVMIDGGWGGGAGGKIMEMLIKAIMRSKRLDNFLFFSSIHLLYPQSRSRWQLHALIHHRTSFQRTFRRLPRRAQMFNPKAVNIFPLM